jgi:hypothetical protein
MNPVLETTLKDIHQSPRAPWSDSMDMLGSTTTPIAEMPAVVASSSMSVDLVAPYDAWATMVETFTSPIIDYLTLSNLTIIQW